LRPALSQVLGPRLRILAELLGPEGVEDVAPLEVLGMLGVVVVRVVPDLDVRGHDQRPQEDDAVGVREWVGDRRVGDRH
jgi:hypothetical protein